MQSDCRARFMSNVHFAMSHGHLPAAECNSSSKWRRDDLLRRRNTLAPRRDDLARRHIAHYHPANVIMQLIRPDLARRVRTPGYLIMALLIVSPLIELCTAAWPFQIHQAAWRLSFVGTAGASLGLPILGLFLIFWLAVLAADTGALLLVSGASVLGGILCVLEAAMFALDALEMKARVRPALAARYDAVSAWWLIKLCAAGAILFVLALSAFRAARSVRRERKAASEKPATLLATSANTPPSTVVSPSR
jgi:hypothetical protein